MATARKTLRFRLNKAGFTLAYNTQMDSRGLWRNGLSFLQLRIETAPDHSLVCRRPTNPGVMARLAEETPASTSTAWQNCSISLTNFTSRSDGRTMDPTVRVLGLVVESLRHICLSRLRPRDTSFFGIRFISRISSFYGTPI